MGATGYSLYGGCGPIRCFVAVADPRWKEESGSEFDSALVAGAVMGVFLYTSGIWGGAWAHTGVLIVWECALGVHRI